MVFRAFAWTTVVVCLSATATAQTPLSLADALGRARAASPALAAARARVEAATEARQRAGRLLNPLFEVRSENWASGAPDGLPLDVFATVAHTVELGGKRGARRAVAEAGLVSATAAAAIAWRDLARTVAAEYLAAVRAREQARARADFATQMAEAARVMARRVDVGTAPEADLLKLRTEETRAIVDRTRAELAAARAASALGASLGLDLTAAALQVPTPPPLPATATVAATHPELRAAAGVVQQAQAAVDLEKARAVPDVGVNAGLKRTSGFNTGVFAITVPIPLFDRNGVARALAEGQLAAAEHERESARLRLTGLAAATRAAADTLAARAAGLDTTLVDPARGAREAARAAFAAGVLDVLRLVDAERLYVDAAVAALDLTIDAVAAAIEARLAAGEDPLP